MAIAIESESSGGSFSTTSPATVMPATVSAGSLLVMLIVASAQTTFTLDAGMTGWTAVLSETNSAGSNGQAALYTKIAAGTEDGVTYTHTFGTSRAYAYKCWSITGAHGDTSISTTATATSTAPDPGSITPAWGSAENLHLAWSANFNSTVTASAYPTGYSSGANITGGGASGVNLAVAVKTATVTSEDPAAFTIGSSVIWRSSVVAIRPTATSVTLTDVDTDETVTAGQVAVVATGTLLDNMNAIGISAGDRTVIVAATATSTTLTATMPTDAAVFAAHVPFGAVTFSAMREDSFLTSTGDWTFSRSGPQTGIDGSGLLYSAASGVAAFVSGQGTLLEGSCTNLLLRSQELDNATWVKTRSSLTANAAVAPDGNTTAEKFVEDTSVTLSHRVRQQVTKAASAIQYTFSIYLKAGERSFASIMLANSTESAQARVGVNLTTGAVSANGGTGWTGVSASSVSVGNGWWRFWITATSDTDTGVNAWVNLATSLNATVEAYTGDGTSGIYVWGAQLEAAAFASSYIPTTTAAVTRSATSLTRAHSFPSNGISGQIVVRPQFASTLTADAQELLCLYKDASNYLKITHPTASGSMDLDLAIGGVTASAQITGLTWASGDSLNVRFRKDSVGIKLWVGASSQATTTGVAPNAWTSTPDTVRVAQDESSGIGFYVVNKIRIWHSAQPDAFMAALT